MKVHNDIVTALDQQSSADWSIGFIRFCIIDHGILSQRLTVSYGFRDSGLNHSYTGGSVSPLDLSSQTLVCFLLVLVYSFQNQTTKKLDRLFLSTRRALSI